MDIMDILNEIISFITQWFKFIACIATDKSSISPNKAPSKTPNNKKVIISLLVGITLILVICAVYRFNYAQSKSSPEDVYTSYGVVSTPNENSESTDPTLNNTIDLDIDFFYKKYYKDNPTSLYDLSIVDLSLSNKIEDFIAFDSIEFTKNSNLKNAQPRIHNLLEKASRLEQRNSKKELITYEEIIRLRTEAYDLCNNYNIARLIGNNYYELFLISTGDQQKLNHARASIQYYVRSILLSQENSQNISYSCMNIATILTTLASDESNSYYRGILYQKSLLYMHMAKQYHTTELYFSYHNVCNSLAITYYNLFELYKNTTSNEFLNYLYNESRELYEDALSDISKLSTEEEDQYRKNLELLHTVYKEYQKNQ